MTAIREEQVLAALRELETGHWEDVLDFIGYQCDFFERTIRAMSKIGQRKTQYLVDDGHHIKFTAGQAVAVHCPTLGRSPIVGREQV